MHRSTEVNDQAAEFARQANEDLETISWTAAGKIVVAAMYEGLASETHIVPNPIENEIGASRWKAEVSHPCKFQPEIGEYLPMPEVGIAGLLGMMIRTKMDLSVLDVRDFVLSNLDPQTQASAFLDPDEIELIGGNEAVFEIFESAGACATALDILYEYSDLVEWVVAQLVRNHRLSSSDLVRHTRIAYGIDLQS